MTSSRRWDIDERGEGVGEATALVPGASELLEALAEPLWVAEDPAAHPLPHLRRACEAGELDLKLETAEVGPDGEYEVTLRWTGRRRDARGARAAAFGLIGWVAESATYVRQRRPRAGDVDGADAGEELRFEVATGMLAPTPSSPRTGMC